MHDARRIRLTRWADLSHLEERSGADDGHPARRHSANAAVSTPKPPCSPSSRRPDDGRQDCRGGALGRQYSSRRTGGGAGRALLPLAVPCAWFHLHNRAAGEGGDSEIRPVQLPQWAGAARQCVRPPVAGAGARSHHKEGEGGGGRGRRGKVFTRGPRTDGEHPAVCIRLGAGGARPCGLWPGSASRGGRRRARRREPGGCRRSL
mmetsp:Transcript_26598/g.64335  ORF Transcript_26598/g.64335 Transcript_26598/m.64335 type:complete len:205 (-) Transcript_26598:2584-3198(-)